MKQLIIGDLHTHYNILEQVKRISGNYDRVIFLGDYLDDWSTVPDASYNILTELVHFKQSNPDKVILLLGNHDFSEWFGHPFHASGYHPLTHTLVEPIFLKNEDLFDIAYTTQDNKFICTHAGFTKSWVDRVLQRKFRSPKALAGLMNKAFHNRENFNNSQQYYYDEIFYSLADVGMARGGTKDPSPIWADLNELIFDPLPGINQIVGHTPVATCTKNDYQTDKQEIYFCDTHSTYRDGTPIGDSSLLVVEEGIVKKITLTGEKELPW